jgi:O-antigen ligase
MNQFELEAAERTLYERGSPVENAHNVYLSLAAETGLIGLGAFLAFALVVAMQAAVASAPGRQTGALALGLSAAMLAFLVQGLTVAQIRVSVLVAILFLYAGMVTGLARRAREAST